jgi:hypothetical protein
MFVFLSSVLFNVYYPENLQILLDSKIKFNWTIGLLEYKDMEG